MNVLIYGATGMVGHGVLRESLLAADVDRVTTVGRTGTGLQNPKLRELKMPDMMNYRGLESELTGFDACFFCLGVSSAGMDEAQYTSITHDLTLAAAQMLVRLNPQMTFVFVSGSGTDSTEKGRVMWARVKGRTENALQRLPFKAVYSFRPGFIQPLHGARSKTKSYRVIYAIIRPLVPLLRALFPRQTLSTETIGRAMLAVARNGAPKPVLEAADINAVATGLPVSRTPRQS